MHSPLRGSLVLCVAYAICSIFSPSLGFSEEDAQDGLLEKRMGDLRLGSVDLLTLIAELNTRLGNSQKILPAFATVPTQHRIADAGDATLREILNRLLPEWGASWYVSGDHLLVAERLMALRHRELNRIAGVSRAITQWLDSASCKLPSQPATLGGVLRALRFSEECKCSYFVSPQLWQTISTTGIIMEGTPREILNSIVLRSGGRLTVVNDLLYVAGDREDPHEDPWALGNLLVLPYSRESFPNPRRQETVYQWMERLRQTSWEGVPFRTLGLEREDVGQEVPGEEFLGIQEASTAAVLFVFGKLLRAEPVTVESAWSPIYAIELRRQ